MRIHRDACNVSYKSVSGPWETREGRRGSSGAQGKCHRGYEAGGVGGKGGCSIRGCCRIRSSPSTLPSFLRWVAPLNHSLSTLWTWTHTHTHTQISGQRNGLGPPVIGILNLSTADIWGQIILLWGVLLCILGWFSCIPPVFYPLEARSTHTPSTTNCDNQIRVQTLPVSSGGRSHPGWRTTSIGKASLVRFQIWWNLCICILN